MEGGALFRVRTEARARVLAEMSKIILHKNEVGGYAYNDATTLITQVERVLERQLYIVGEQVGPEVGLLLGHKGLHKCTKVYESFHRFGSWELRWNYSR